MAEQVQAHLENMSGEFQELQRLSLFSAAEAKHLTKKREHFEYKINGLCKSLEDIKEYINHERCFLKYVKLKREKMKVYGHRKYIEQKVIGRVKSLYEIGMNLKPDYAFSLAYFEFCKMYEYHDVAKMHLMDMISKFSDKPEIWQIASSYFRNINKNEARSILHQGLQKHKDNKSLYLEAIELELYRPNNETLDEKLTCQRLQVYLEAIFKNTDFLFWIDVLKLLDSFEITKPVQNIVVEKLLDKYSDQELAWQCLAEREKDGHYYEYKFIQLKSYKKLNELNPMEQLERCFKLYEVAFEKVPSNKKQDLWFAYLDTLENIRNQELNIPNVIKNNFLCEKFQNVENQIKFEDRHYISWLQCCNEDQDAAEEVLEKATKALPKSCILWELRLKYFIKQVKVKTVQAVFDEATKCLGDESVRIWKTYLEYHKLKSMRDTIKDLYLKGLNESDAIANALKPDYIEWLALFEGIGEARKEYKQLANKVPYCKELHQAMVQAETYCIGGFDLDYNEWENVLKLACDQFGKSDIDVYLNYVIFYQKYNKVPQANEKIRQIYEDAQKNLPEELFEQFKEKFDST